MTSEQELLRPALDGIKVVDVSSLGPGPFCSMLLADYGAEVISVERPDAEPTDPSGFFSRGKRSIAVDLRADGGSEIVRRLVSAADVFIEGYRPGTMERRGLGPADLLALNPGLVYARLTGYGQSGPYSMRAGHDINYLATSGVLGVLGTDRPVPPLNILGDFAGGSLNAVQGLLLALLVRHRTGQGQVVDAAMTDGAAALLAGQFAELAMGGWRGRGHGLLSGNAPFYGVYACADGRWFAVGAIEERFYSVLVKALGLDEAELPERLDPAHWGSLRDTFAAAFARKPRDHWRDVFADVDACGSPVLELEELAQDPHLSARATVLISNGVVQAAPAPRLSGASMEAGPLVQRRGQHGAEILEQAGFTAAEIDDYLSRGALTVQG
jgi:alpha-methylacyl-CoA racemase